MHPWASPRSVVPSCEKEPRRDVGPAVPARAAGPAGAGTPPQLDSTSSRRVSAPVPRVDLGGGLQQFDPLDQTGGLRIDEGDGGLQGLALALHLRRRDGGRRGPAPRTPRVRSTGAFAGHPPPNAKHTSARATHPVRQPSFWCACDGLCRGMRSRILFIVPLDEGVVRTVSDGGRSPTAGGAPGRRAGAPSEATPKSLFRVRLRGCGAVGGGGGGCIGREGGGVT